jgi:EAL domain-containing protein (putative c-di-GMP-specific phosphodiesterase class I)
MGASIYPDNAMTIDALFSTADMAMYQVKEQGRNGFQFYDASLNEKLQYSILMEKELKKALKNNEFELMYQPKYVLSEHSVYEAEALIRWRHPEKGILMPSEFLSFAEKNGLIKEIGAWVIDETCRQCRYLFEKGMKTRISVNVSAKQLRDKNFVSQVRDSINKYKIDANLLEFEISEAILMDNLTHLTPIVKALKALHVKIAVDGFGKAFSSLGYMNRLPIDTIKIDKNLLNELSINNNNRELIAMMIAFGHAKNMSVITEGVEVESLFNLSRELKADQAQGYYFSKPKDIDELIVYYQNFDEISA